MVFFFFLFIWSCTTLHFRTTWNVFFRCVPMTWSCGKLIDSIGFWFCEQDGSSFNLVTTLVLTIVKPLSYFDQTVWFLQSWKNDDWLHARLTGSDTRHETSVMQCLPGGEIAHFLLQIQVVWGQDALCIYSWWVRSIKSVEFSMQTMQLHFVVYFKGPSPVHSLRAVSHLLWALSPVL